MTDKEKAICNQYSKRDINGKVHCSDCPLVIDKTACVCKKCNSAKQKLHQIRKGGIKYE